MELFAVQYYEWEDKDEDEIYKQTKWVSSMEALLTLLQKLIDNSTVELVIESILIKKVIVPEDALSFAGWLNTRHVSFPFRKEKARIKTLRRNGKSEDDLLDLIEEALRQFKNIGPPQTGLPKIRQAMNKLEQAIAKAKEGE